MPILRGLLLAVLLAGFSAGCDRHDSAKRDFSTVSVPAGYKDFKASQYSVKYPATWNQNYDGKLQFFRSPQEGAGDMFQENLNINLITVSSGTTAASGAKELERGLPAQITGPKFLVSAPLKLANESGHLVIYTGNLSAGGRSFSLKWAQAIIVKNTQAYVLTFTAEQTQFDKYWPTAQAIFTSFRAP